jgi:L-amino acid N-acyltransferase YncA
MASASTNRVTIRLAALSDATAIAEIWLAGVPDAFGIPTPSDIAAVEWFQERLFSQNETFRYWVAHDREMVMGWCSLQPCRNNPLSHRRMGEISTYISPDASQRGIAPALIQHLIDHAASVGIGYVVGHARAGNTRILGLLDSMGWVQVGQMPSNTSLGPEPLVYLARTIERPS